jgi:uncharacterized SAM-binding protein YcdF (DUF218 family)
MYTLAASIVWGILQPSNLIAVLAALALVMAVLGMKRSAKLAGGTSTLLLILFGLLPTGQILIAPLEDRFPQPDLGVLDHVEGIIVLGGAESPPLTRARDTVTVKDTGGRLTTGLMLAERFPEALILSTAGYRDKGLTQAEVAGRLFLEAGVNPHRLILETESHNTYENAVLSRKLVDPQPTERWLLVTSAFHMPRSVAVFNATDWKVIPFPTDYRSLPKGELNWRFDVASRLREADLALHEWIGLIAYRLMGRTETLYPAPLN